MQKSRYTLQFHPPTPDILGAPEPNPCYGFNGMEKDDEHSQGKYDFGARIYDSRIGRWLAGDPLESNYPYATTYGFALNTPLQAKDPDGRVVIFINGLDNHQTEIVFSPITTFSPIESFNYYSSFENSSLTNEVLSYLEKFGVKQSDNPFSFISFGANGYWQGWDLQAAIQIGDTKLHYVDGSPGGLFESLNDEVRLKMGYLQGYQEAKAIIDNLDDGETIKIVTHSMGGVFGRGYIEGIKEFVNDYNANVAELRALAEQMGMTYDGHGEIEMPVFEFVVDIAPFWGNGEAIPAVRNVTTYQMNGGLDGISIDILAPGSYRIGNFPNTGHFIMEYDPMELPQSKAQFLQIYDEMIFENEENEEEITA